MSDKKTVEELHTAPAGHWVGDGFPVRSVIARQKLGDRLSPFLLLDYGGPHEFAPASAPRGVGGHPHKGFETVTIVFQGEVTHRDSTGSAGTIQAGDVQWMTAGAGILHEEMHSEAFTRSGGPFEMVQLWVNLPAKHKGTPAGYQSIVDADIPMVEMAGGRVRVIAGAVGSVAGPARTFTPVHVWDVQVNAGEELTLDLPAGFNSGLVGLRGAVAVGEEELGSAELAVLSREGTRVALRAGAEGARVLVLSGEPIEEPVVGYGPFVMNTQEEIAAAVRQFQSGEMGRLD